MLSFIRNLTCFTTTATAFSLPDAHVPAHSKKSYNLIHSVTPTSSGLLKTIIVGGLVWWLGEW
jgi:hypothetical protein